MTSAARTIIEATEDWGPGPPPFRVPPPPLPPFMLPDDLTDQEFCQTTLKPSLDSHLDVCDTTFVSSINLLKTAYLVHPGYLDPLRLKCRAYQSDQSLESDFKLSSYTSNFYSSGFLK